jgi:peptidoglycan/LPS O-acetylase OafA/YrhL
LNTIIEPEIRERAIQHPPKQRMLPLDGIRGLAIIGVLLTHGSYVFRTGDHVLAMGWTGVDLFFVLSGFLITGILIDTKAAQNRGKSFYARRILRIFPIYYLTIFLVLIAQQHIEWIRAVAEMQMWPDRLSYLLYFKNFVPLWHQGEAHQTLLSHFWSLAGEEQFYCLWPLVVWHLSTKSIYRVCAAALCFTLLLRTILSAHFGYGAWMLFCPLTRSDGLFVGSGLAALLASGYRLSHRHLLTWGSGGVATLLLVVVLRGRKELLYGGPLMSTIGFSGLATLFGVLIAYSVQSSTGLARFFETAWLRSFGRYSYGIYVYHLPVYYVIEHFSKQWVSLKFPLPDQYAILYLGLLIAVSYSVSWLSFRYFEQRFLRLKRHFEPVFQQSPIPVQTNLTEASPSPLSYRS